MLDLNMGACKNNYSYIASWVIGSKCLLCAVIKPRSTSFCCGPEVASVVLSCGSPWIKFIASFYLHLCHTHYHGVLVAHCWHLSLADFCCRCHSNVLLRDVTSEYCQKGNALTAVNMKQWKWPVTRGGGLPSESKAMLWWIRVVLCKRKFDDGVANNNLPMPV